MIFIRAALFAVPVYGMTDRIINVFPAMQEKNPMHNTILVKHVGLENTAHKEANVKLARLEA